MSITTKPSLERITKKLVRWEKDVNDRQFGVFGIDIVHGCATERAKIEAIKICVKTLLTLSKYAHCDDVCDLLTAHVDNALTQIAEILCGKSECS